MDEAPDTSVPRWLIVIVAIAVVAGVFFRFYHLDRKVFWDDEVMAAVHMSGHTEANVVEASPHMTTAAELKRFMEPEPGPLRLAPTVNALAAEDPHIPPFYYVAERAWESAFGGSATAIRSLSAVFGALALAAVYWLALELFASPVIALLTLGLVALSPLYVLYAQEAREYSMWTLAFVFDCVLFLRAARTNAPIAWAAYALASAAALYVNPLTGFVILGCGVYLLIRDRGRVTGAVAPFILSVIVALALCVPWARVMISNPNLGRGLGGIALSRITPVELVVSTIRDLRLPYFDLGTFRIGPIGSTLVHFVLSVLIITVIAWALYRLVARRPFAVWGFIIVALCLPLAPLIFKGQIVIQTRYFFPLLLGMQLAVAALLAALIFGADDRRITRFGGAALLAIIIGGEFASCLLSAPATTWWSKNFQQSQAVAAVVNRTPNAVVVSDYAATAALALSRYLDPGVHVRLELACELCLERLPYRPDLMDTGGYTTVFYLQIPSATNTGNVRWINPRPYPRNSDPLNLFLHV